MQPSHHLVVGLGQTGLSIARFLQRRNVPFAVFDTRVDPVSAAAFKADFPNIELFQGELPDSVYGPLNGVICSPGISLDEPFIQKATQMGIPVFGDIDCLAREVKQPIIAITGTNGKSTVTTLVGEMAKASGLSVAVAGNIGLPVLDILDVGVTYDLWVLELSSFQLDLTHSLVPRAATILNITPDHLNRHHTLEAYTASKHRVYTHADIILYNRDDKLTVPEIESKSPQRVISFGVNRSDDNQWGLTSERGKTYLAKGAYHVMDAGNMLIKGRHNWLNALAACALADAVGIPERCMIDVLQRFAGLPHRCQWVRTLKDVDWINDSKATNVGAAISAIAGIGDAMQGKIILIAGGQGKEADFGDLRQPITEYVRTVVLIGEDAHLIEDIVPDAVEVIRAGTLEQAVSQARYHARPGDVVLLSPACASFDMFRDFNHRGDDFIAAVNAL